MKSERKMVMMEPSDVLRLRVKPVRDSLKKYMRLDIETVHSPVLVAGQLTAVKRDNATTHVVDHFAVVRGDKHRGARAIDSLEKVHDAARSLRVEIARGLRRTPAAADDSRWLGR